MMHHLAAYKPDESNVGVWLWLFMLVDFIVTIYAIDWWLHAHNHEYLTTEFREGLRDEVWGPVLCFLTAGTFAAFVWHMWSEKP